MTGICAIGSMLRDPKNRIVRDKAPASTFLVHHAKLFDPTAEVFVG